VVADRRVIVEAAGVTKTYKMGPTTVSALRGIDLRIYAGEYISIMGPSGSGKTTFFNMVGALDRPTTGKVLIDGVDVSSLSAQQTALLRCRRLGYIFQTYNIIPVMTALENVMLPMTFAGASDEEAEARAAALLTKVGLGQRLKHRPSELSGGQQQRVAIARAMANNPAIILADEPTGNLDLATGREIIDTLKRMKEESGVTIIASTHDMKMLSTSDRVVWIRDGRIERIEKREDMKIEVGTIEGKEH
jgi:putative ABC transport system ATP-binding protein